jgi:hypothetical protein
MLNVIEPVAKPALKTFGKSRADLERIQPLGPNTTAKVSLFALSVSMCSRKHAIAGFSSSMRLTKNK